ncbi:MAG: transketolase [Spirochaetales bacterium]|nr:transketolase [Spirochaetales bacterium]
METVKLEKQALLVRELIIEAIGDLGVGHIGGSLSIVEVLTTLYYECMTVDPANPLMSKRDRLVLSKGHAGPALYAVLASKGYFPIDWLKTLNAGGTRLPSHCDRRLTPGIDMSTGSLGQGLSAAIGMALGSRMDGLDNWIYAILGDGESDEGQVWEAAMAGAHFELDRLIAFTDYNKMNIDGYTRDIMNLDDLGAKWSAFNWHVQRVNGHEIEEIINAVARAKKVIGRPSMIILDTVKGKDCSFAEGKISSHNMTVSLQQKEEALALLKKKEKLYA